jgi:fatty acid desaturase
MKDSAESSSLEKRPALPAEFHRPEPAWVALYFAYGFGLYIGCGYAAYATAASDWAVIAKIPVIALTAFLASNGLHVLGWLAHEGIHLSIVKGKAANMLLGAFAGSPLFFPSVGLGISHWPHHRFTNLPNDPDTALQAKHQTFWRRLLLARPTSNRQYLANAVSVLLRRPRDKTWRLPFSDAALQMYSAAGFAFMALWLALYVYVGMQNVEHLLWGFVVPFLLLIPTTGVRPYLEHAGTEAGRFRDARSYTSPFYTVLLFGNNYHLEHHLYPNVPGYKLPKLHRWLESQEYFAHYNSPIVSGVAAPLRYTTRQHRYPEPTADVAEPGPSRLTQAV